MKSATGKCVCGCRWFEKVKEDYIQCVDCGIIRRSHFNSPEEYVEDYQSYYSSPRKDYTGKVKDYKHDREVAFARCRSYGISINDRIFDVGSGSGAFVDECRNRGADAYGCEITKCSYLPENAFVYYQSLEDTYFPTDYFDMVTCHDVLEHFLDPIQILNEMFRITKQEGRIIIDFPNFFVDEGIHHWKREHLWCFTAEQLEKILQDIGLVIDKILRPIMGKLVFYCSKPKTERVRILVPPGIGDSYWSLVKMKSFIEKHNLGIPDVFVFCDKDRQGTRHSRSFGFIEMFPFIYSAKENRYDPELRPIWEEAYLREGRTVFQNVAGCDYFIAYNGVLRFGKSLEQVDKDLKCDWHPSLFVSLEQDNFKNACMKKYGKYLVFYFVFQGTYSHWTKQFSISRVISYIQKVAKETGYTPVLVGAAWDKEEKLLKKLKANIPGCVDMIGKTNIDQLFGLIRGSELLVGYPSGLSIMATVLKKKTLIIWNDYYSRDFAWHSCPPDTWNKNYFIENTKNIDVGNLVKTSINITEGKVIESRLPLPEHPKVSSPVKDKKISVFCVLKSGGDYAVDYVVKLRNMLERHVTVPFEFICLTDIEIDESICQSIKLTCGYNGWWSKIEMFRAGLTGADQTIYFDLDTVILKNIDDLLLHKHNFSALRPWNEKNRKNGMCASGMMAWKNNSFSFLFDQFKSKDIENYQKGDQEYISQALAGNGKNPDFLQEMFSGIYSYKRNCKKGFPEDARVVCFHGRPRPHQMRDKWVIENWR